MWKQLAYLISIFVKEKITHKYKNEYNDFRLIGTNNSLPIHQMLDIAYIRDRVTKNELELLCVI